MATVESGGDTLLRVVMMQKVDTGVTKAQLLLLNSDQLFQPLDHKVAYFFNVLGSWLYTEMFLNFFLHN